MTQYVDWGEEASPISRPPSPFRVHDFFLFVVERKGRILWSTLAITVLALVIVVGWVKDNYDSTAVIMPPRQDQSVSALLSGQAGLAALGGGAVGGIGLNLKNPNDIYPSMLASRTLTTQLVRQFNLQQYYGKKHLSDAIKTLQRHTKIDLGQDNLIRITVTTHDANFSSQLANAYVARLHEMNTSLALTDAAQRRLFFEQQLDQEKALLSQAEVNLQQTQSNTGLFQPYGQGVLLVQNLATLREQITERQAAIDSFRTSVTKENPQYIAMKAQLTSLQKRLVALESSQQPPAPGDIEVPTVQLPKASLEYLRRFREVQQHEQLYALLLKQLDAAKIDEAKTAPVIQVIDPAIAADHSSGLSRWFLIPISSALALLLNILLAGAHYVYGTLRRLQADSVS